MARSNPVPALYASVPFASSNPIALLPVVVQFGVAGAGSAWHGCEIVPTVMSWKMQLLAGELELQLDAVCWPAREYIMGLRLPWSPPSF